VNIALILLLAAVVPVASLRFASGASLAVGAGVGIVFAVGAQLAFNAGVIIDFINPLLALALAVIGSLAVLYLFATVERDRVRGLFARFVPGSVVDEVLARTDQNLRLGALEVDCTVMFSDLRGFTTFSEEQSPPRVLALVNFYLDEMTDAILAAGGTLISYIGDGIMALFGAPLEQPDHADRALAAAREMVGPRLARFNEWMMAEGFETGFRMGIGLHSGTVMAGNIGSDDRLSYTAIGDTVNTASRLESLTKIAGYALLLSGPTRMRLTREAEDLVFVGDLNVRGRAEQIAAWSISSAQIPAPASLPTASRSDPAPSYASGAPPLAD
jgi:adenylate cyclase